MTNNTPTARRDAITALAKLILTSIDPAINPSPNLDHIDLAHALLPIMTPTDHADLCLALDLCPLHIRDIEICADDQIESCRADRAHD